VATGALGAQFDPLDEAQQERDQRTGQRRNPPRARFGAVIEPEAVSTQEPFVARELPIKQLGRSTDQHLRKMERLRGVIGLQAALNISDPPEVNT
jgi:hypothetical protein